MTTLLQVTNVSPLATKDQLQTLFNFVGHVDELVVYPPDDNTDTPSRVCYVRFREINEADVARHLFNTVFLDRALIIFPVPNNEIPDEAYAYLMRAPADTTAGVCPRTASWPENVISMVIGKSGEQLIHTIDPRMCRLGLPTYPPLPSTTDANRLEEIRRTVLVTGLGPYTTAEQIMDFLSQAGEVRYVRLAGSDLERAAYVEFTEQPSIIKVFSLNGSLFNGQQIRIQHASCAIIKPANLAGIVMEPVGLAPVSATHGSRSRSRGHSSRRRRRSSSRSRSRHRRSRHRSKSPRRSRSRDRRRRSPSYRRGGDDDRNRSSRTSKRREDSRDSLDRNRSSRRSRRSRSRSSSGRPKKRERSRSRDRRRDSRERHRSKRSSRERAKDKDKDRRSPDRRRERTKEKSSREDSSTKKRDSKPDNDRGNRGSVSSKRNHDSDSQEETYSVKKSRRTSEEPSKKKQSLDESNGSLPSPNGRNGADDDKSVSSEDSRVSHSHGLGPDSVPVHSSEDV